MTTMKKVVALDSIYQGQKTYGPALMVTGMVRDRLGAQGKVEVFTVKSILRVKEDEIVPAAVKRKALHDFSKKEKRIDMVLGIGEEKKGGVTEGGASLTYPSGTEPLVAAVDFKLIVESIWGQNPLYIHGGEVSPSKRQEIYRYQPLGNREVREKLLVPQKQISLLVNEFAYVLKNSLDIGSISAFQYKEAIDRLSKMVHGFADGTLTERLSTATKNIVQEVIVEKNAARYAAMDRMVDLARKYGNGYTLFVPMNGSPGARAKGINYSMGNECNFSDALVMASSEGMDNHADVTVKLIYASLGLQ